MTAEKLWYKDMPTGKRRKIIPDKLRRVFAGKQIVCVEYQDITENDEREIFQRAQLGMGLTPAEKLQVINTPRVLPPVLGSVRIFLFYDSTTLRRI
ncbi:hypothetical protein FA15DRAFT_709187 [Coprinopsis marcescibilis]|uniref:Uncharacterized protein n=1 Tax=Coprinopsis marcescibilis TaxID=230819 RepID=A0A5C3KH81_COPMA|nr:hypothetical protein FA15DRAFT_709187 [Coprinopsis marcescibilis]